eukprot:Pgem_evm1s9062
MVFSHIILLSSSLVIAQAEQLNFDFYQKGIPDAQLDEVSYGHVFFSGSSDYLFSFDENKLAYHCEKNRVIIDSSVFPTNIPAMPFIGVATKCETPVMRVTIGNPRLKTFSFDRNYRAMNDTDIKMRIIYSNNPHFEEVARTIDHIHANTTVGEKVQKIGKLMAPKRRRRFAFDNEICSEKVCTPEIPKMCTPDIGCTPEICTPAIPEICTPDIGCSPEICTPYVPAACVPFTSICTPAIPAKCIPQICPEICTPAIPEKCIPQYCPEICTPAIPEVCTPEICIPDITSGTSSAEFIYNTKHRIFDYKEEQDGNFFTATIDVIPDVRVTADYGYDVEIKFPELVGRDSVMWIDHVGQANVAVEVEMDLKYNYNSIPEKIAEFAPAFDIAVVRLGPKIELFTGYRLNIEGQFNAKATTGMSYKEQSVEFYPFRCQYDEFEIDYKPLELDLDPTNHITMTAEAYIDIEIHGTVEVEIDGSYNPLGGDITIIDGEFGVSLEAGVRFETGLTSDLKVPLDIGLYVTGNAYVQADAGPFKNTWDPKYFFDEYHSLYKTDNLLDFEPETDGAWSNWGSYSSCSKTCGSGSQTRYRTCTNPLPSHGGKICSGSHEETISCNTHSCNTIPNGQWTEWGSYSSCSALCGTGTQTRTRECNNGNNCGDGLSTQQQTCNTHPCSTNPGEQWSNWGSFSECSVPCGTGYQYRTRMCNNGENCPGLTTEYKECNENSCNGGSAPVPVPTSTSVSGATPISAEIHSG